MGTKKLRRRVGRAAPLVAVALIVGVSACTRPVVAPDPTVTLPAATAEPTTVPTPIARTITGTVLLQAGYSHEGLAFGLRCWGAPAGGYSDIDIGAQVTVRDAGGVIIGTGSLSQGEMDPGNGCHFPFRIIGLPEATFYSVQVSHRDGPSYSFAEMEAAGWDIALSLGD